MPSRERLRVFVPSAASLLTSRSGHGEGLIAWRLLAGLAERGHEVVACVRELEGEPPFETVRVGRASRFESVEPLAYARAVSRVFARRGGVQAFDVVHWLFPERPVETAYAPPPGVGFVLGPLFPGWPGRARPRRAGDAVRLALRPLHARRRRLVLERADALLLSSPAAASELPRRLRSRARVVPPGVDAGRFTPAEEPGGERVLFVGRLEEAKGVRELVEAFAAVRRARPSASLVLAGDGPERGWVEAVAGGDGVSILGAVAHDDVPRLVADAAVVCIPSRREPYGMALVEAMAAGRPVVATADGGPAHLVDPVRGGRLVPAADPPALAAALVELLADGGLRAEMGAFNRRRVEEELALERSLDLLERVYAEVAP